MQNWCKKHNTGQSGAVPPDALRKLKSWNGVIYTADCCLDCYNEYQRTYRIAHKEENKEKRRVAAAKRRAAGLKARPEHNPNLPSTLAYVLAVNPSKTKAFAIREDGSTGWHSVVGPKGAEFGDIVRIGAARRVSKNRRAWEVYSTAQFALDFGTRSEYAVVKTLLRLGAQMLDANGYDGESVQ